MSANTSLAIDIEQAMVLNKLHLRSLLAVLGVIRLSQDLPGIVTWIERLSNGSDMKSTLSNLASVGEERYRSTLQALRPAICKDWGYCQQKAIDGLGNPRRLIGSLAQLVASNQSLLGKISHSELLVISVLLSRTDLNGLCECESALVGESLIRR